eukprot:TRINITY_DN9292_c0_g2_i6.p1 TRINITY_DN9292_c0_g2~~TRINITY_DN9292_c0_g2_i6.p1  ORF type:complete len:331 (+),score=52.35 TRINITY_DN9292_c0_g2_i6:124-1116(+)
MMAFAVTVGMVTTLSISATSAKSLLTNPPPGAGSFYLTPNTTRPPIFHHQLYGPLGRSINTTANWHVTQWSSWKDLPTKAVYNQQGDCTAHPTPPAWFASSSSSRVCSWPHQTVELSQNGHGLPCGEEFDTFLGPNTHVYANYPSGMQPSPPLNELSSLIVRMNITLPMIPVVTDRCGTSPQCQGNGHVDYGYAVLGVVMDNPSAEQTLFYQVNLGDTRDYTGCPHHANACDLSPLRWYANQNPFGATDTPQNYNATCLKMSSASPGAVGNAVDYRLDVLPKLLRALAQGPSGLVKMASEWLVSGCYIGLGMQGNVSQSLYVHHFDIQES